MELPLLETPLLVMGKVFRFSVFGWLQSSHTEHGYTDFSYSCSKSIPTLPLSLSSSTPPFFTPPFLPSFVFFQPWAYHSEEIGLDCSLGQMAWTSVAWNTCPVLSDNTPWGIFLFILRFENLKDVNPRWGLSRVLGATGVLPSLVVSKHRLPAVFLCSCLSFIPPGFPLLLSTCTWTIQSSAVPSSSLSAKPPPPPHWHPVWCQEQVLHTAGTQKKKSAFYGWSLIPYHEFGFPPRN